MQLFEKLNKLGLPATIIIASIILGGFFYATQVSKQKSIERQQQIELEARQQEKDEQAERETQEKFDRSLCLIEAERKAGEQYKEDCTYDCKEGYFYIKDKDNYLETCLQRKGLK